MLVITCNPNVTPLAKVYDTMFLYYRDTIVSYALKQWKEEDIKGESCLQLHQLKHFLAFAYVLLLSVEEQEGLLTDNVLIEKYDIEHIKKCFACSEISIEKLFEIAGINLVANADCPGINTHGVEHNWGIGQMLCLENPEVSTLPAYTVIQNLLAENNVKTILVPANC